MLDDRDWEVFKRKLKAKTEIDLDLYKAPQMKRRIGNLVQRNGMDSYEAYFDHAAKDKDTFAAFIEYLTINVSEFFRTPEKFGKLETDVIPKTSGPAKGFLKYSCKRNPLVGMAIPAKSIAKARLIRNPAIWKFSVSELKKSEKVSFAKPILRLTKKAIIARTIIKITRTGKRFINKFVLF